MKAVTLWPFAAVLLFAACALLPGAPPPETAARDTYRAAKKACQVYELLPAERHTEEADRECRSLRLICEE